MTERAFTADAREAKGLHDGSITRAVRVVEPQPVIRDGRVFLWGCVYDISQLGEPVGEWRSRAMVYCPFGVVGDRLWVQEEWAQMGTPHGPRVIHKAERCGALLGAIFDDEETGEGVDWQPASEMHHESCRTLLDVTGVRVVRAQAVTGVDYAAMGIPMPEVHGMEAVPVSYWTCRFGPGTWDANPWLWLGSVKTVEAT